jgi:hypothetical protein
MKNDQAGDRLDNCASGVCMSRYDIGDGRKRIRGSVHRD